uniref:Protein kinase domain-containing protein n=1 Tax=Talaromyces marneffei PM1 TaxID=1077442 RepID=A0A093UWQ3_TALMA
MLVAKASSMSERLSRLLDPQSIDSTDHLCGDSSSLKERLQWALRSGKAMERLELLTTLVRDLESFLPPPGSDSNVTGAIILNSALTSEQDALKLRWLSRQTDFDSFTRSLALLKATNMTHVNELGLDSEFELPKLNGIVQRMRTSETGRHYLGTYNGDCVLIERKTIPSEKNNYTVIDDRIQKIVHLLKLSQGIEGLRTLPCLGYIKREPGLDLKSEKWDLSQRSLSISVFRSPELLRKQFSVYTLPNGFIRESGVATLSSYPQLSLTPARVRLNLPYLVGFECSRTNSHDEGTENIAGTEESNLYRHPAAQGLPKAEPDSYPGDTGRFSKNHDIYSLGVILIELGVLMSAGRIKSQARKYDPDYGKHSAEKFQRLLLDKLVPKVAFTMGEVYANVTFCCLNADFYHPSPQLHHKNANTFYPDVVAELELCRA